MFTIDIKATMEYITSETQLIYNLYFNDKIIGELYGSKHVVDKIIHMLNTHPLIDE